MNCSSGFASVVGGISTNTYEASTCQQPNTPRCGPGSPACIRTRKYGGEHPNAT